MGYKYNKRCAKSKESTPFCSYCFAFRPQSLVFSRGERWYLFAVYDKIVLVVHEKSPKSSISPRGRKSKRHEK